jgi:transcriptional regulator with PAS, ATPase and Fis domain
MPEAEPLLFLVLDASNPLAPPVRWRLRGAREAVIGRADRRDTILHRKAKDHVDLEIILDDAKLSRRHARLVVDGPHWCVDDFGSKNGTLVNGVPVKARTPLTDGDCIEMGRTFFLYRDARTVRADDPLVANIKQLVHPTPDLATIIPDYHRALADLARIATNNTVNVMLGGETGTGKEVTARSVHVLSGRTGDFVAVNCGAIPANLVESELFGFRKGAFSGATEDRPGKIRAAHRGTLFLDEIGDLPLPAQAAFLRVLQDRQVVPVGSVKETPVDIRVVCATHRDLRDLIDKEAFRDDLFARLEGFSLELPSLRARREDFGLLVAALISKLAGDRVIKLDNAAARAMMRYDWPRNIRELETVLKRALVLTDDGTITTEHLPESVRRPAVMSEADEEATLRALCEKHRGNLVAIGRELRRDRAHVHRLLQRHGIDPDEFRFKKS